MSRSPAKQLNQNSRAWTFFEISPVPTHKAIVGCQFTAEPANGVLVVVPRAVSLPRLYQSALRGDPLIDGPGEGSLRVRRRQPRRKDLARAQQPVLHPAPEGILPVDFTQIVRAVLVSREKVDSGLANRITCGGDDMADPMHFTFVSSSSNGGPSDSTFITHHYQH